VGIGNAEVGMRPPARRGHRGLRPGGKAGKKEAGKLRRWEKSKTEGWGGSEGRIGKAE
jgi:hypothetical protein